MEKECDKRIEKMQYTKKIKLSYECYVREGNYIWAAAFDHNGLYKINTRTDKVEFIGLFMNEKKYECRLYASAVKVGGKIVFIPFTAREIAVYDILNNTIQKIGLKTIESFGNHQHANELCKFWSSTKWENTVYMLPHNYPAIVLMDVNTLELRYCSEFIDELERMSVNDATEPYVTDLYQNKQMIYCSCGCANAVILMNLKELYVEVHNIPVNTYGFNGILKDEQYLWLAPRRDGGLTRYDTVTGETEQYTDYPLGFEAPMVPFHSLYKYHEGFLLLPALGNQFIYFDKEKGTMDNVDYLSRLICIKKEEGVYSFDITMAYSVDGNQLTFMNGMNYNWCIVDLDNNKVETKTYWIENNYPRSEVLWWYRHTHEVEMVILENYGIRLLDYLHVVCAEDKNCESTEIEQGGKLKGGDIYGYIAKNI